MTKRKFIVLFIALLFGIIQTGCAGVKIMPEVKSIEGKIILARTKYTKGDQVTPLYIVIDSTLWQIPNTDFKEIKHVYWSPDGTMIAFYGYNGNKSEERAESRGIYIIEEKGSNLKLIQKGILYPFDFSINGKQIIYRDYSFERKKEEFYIFNIDDSGLRKLTDEEVTKYSQTSRWPSYPEVKISPDGRKKLWYKISSKNVPPNELYMTNLDTGEEILIAKGSASIDIENAVWSANSKNIMYLRESIYDYQQIKLYDLETKKTTTLMKFGGRYVEGFDWWTPPVK